VTEVPAACTTKVMANATPALTPALDSPYGSYRPPPDLRRQLRGSARPTPSHLERFQVGAGGRLDGGRAEHRALACRCTGPIGSLP
jgi:hypothetical protein